MTIDGVEVTVEDVMGVTEQEAMEYVAYGRQHIRGAAREADYQARQGS